MRLVVSIRFSDINYHTRLSLQTALVVISETSRKWFSPEIIVSNETTTITGVRFPLYAIASINVDIHSARGTRI